MSALGMVDPVVFYNNNYLNLLNWGVSDLWEAVHGRMKQNISTIY